MQTRYPSTAMDDKYSSKIDLGYPFQSQYPRVSLFSESTMARFSASLDALRLSSHGPLFKDVAEECLGQENKDQRLAPFWLDIANPTREELGFLSKIFPIHPLTIEDIVENDTREKSEIFDSYLFVVFKTCDQDVSSELFLECFCVYVVLFDNFIITLHDRCMPHVSKILKKLDSLHSSSNSSTQLLSLSSSSSLGSSSSFSADWVMYALFDDIIDGFLPLVKTTECEIDTIDELVLLLSEADKTDMIRRIGVARKRTITLLRIMAPKRDLLKGLDQKHSSKLSPTTSLYLRDTQDHIISLCQSLENFMETLNTSHANYLAQISIELAEGSNRINNSVSKLTIVASIFIPLTFISGLMGMNVIVPGQSGHSFSELGPFAYVLFFMVIVAVICVYGAQRLRMV